MNGDVGGGPPTRGLVGWELGLGCLLAFSATLFASEAHVWRATCVFCLALGAGCMAMLNLTLWNLQDRGMPPGTKVWRYLRSGPPDSTSRRLALRALALGTFAGLAIVVGLGMGLVVAMRVQGID
jgi:hypothetical protein